jgi:hypothetical protein
MSDGSAVVAELDHDGSAVVRLAQATPGKKSGPAPLGGWGGTERRSPYWEARTKAVCTAYDNDSSDNRTRSDQGVMAQTGYPDFPRPAPTDCRPSTGTWAVVVVGWEVRPNRPNFCPVAIPPSHTETIAITAPAMSSAM